MNLEGVRSVIIPDMRPIVRAEFHCHTRTSKDSLTSVASLLAECQRKKIDRLVITDHNGTSGALQAQQLDPARVIIGEEIMTQKGELLACFVTEELPKGLPPLEAIRLLRQQGAFISVSHPFDHARHGAWALPDLLEIAPLVDAIETFNSRCLSNQPNLAAQAFAIEYGLPGTAGSDAHINWEVGRATLVLPDFKNAAELRQSLSMARCEGFLSPFWVHIASTVSRWIKRFSRRSP
jgi:predicted metal-dependent phosphoesterase TrpH